MFKTATALLSLLFFSLALISCGNAVVPNPSDPDGGYPNIVEMLPASDSIWVDSGSVSLEDTSFTYTLLDTIISYYDRVDSTIDSIISGDTVWMYDTTKGVERLDIYETNQTVDSVSGKFKFNWNGINGATVYYVWVSDSASGEVLYFKSDSTDTTYNVMGLVPDRIYNVSVTGYDSVDNRKSYMSDKAVVRLRYPAPPPYLEADVIGSTIKLSWLKNSSDIGVNGYKAYLYNSTGATLDSVEITNVNSLSALFSTTPNSVYKAAVITKTSIGYGSIDSLYPYDHSNLFDAKIRFPSIFISTYSTPISLDGDLIGVAGGGFLMGKIWSDETVTDSYIAGLPLHEVELSSFFIGKSEVTNIEYANFLNTLDSSKLSIIKDSLNRNSYIYQGELLLENSKYVVFDSATQKIIVPDTLKRNFALSGIYFEGAAYYCNYLSEQRGFQPAYTDSLELDTTKNGFRLPTEAEFEYVQSVAFLGTKERFPWGYNDETSRYVASGTEPDNAYFGEPYFGIYNMTGNVEELCADATDRNSKTYPNSFYKYCDSIGVVKNPINLTKGNKIIRGGGFKSSKEEFVSNIRVVDMEDDHSTYGFRVARWDR